jgi:phage baseplate assembly protein W
MSIGLVLPIEKGNKGMFNVSEDILTQIKSNFINLILTIPGERMNNPEFGCRIHNVIFDPIGDELNERAELTVQEAVDKWMPFLQMEEFQVLTNNNDIDRNVVQLYVKYTLSDSPNLSDEVLISF